jgi:hypothetical protein
LPISPPNAPAPFIIQSGLSDDGFTVFSPPAQPATSASPITNSNANLNLFVMPIPPFELLCQVLYGTILALTPD